MSDSTYSTFPPLDPLLWWQAVRRVFQMIDEKNLGLISAGVAFYAILAVFPGLAATISIWAIVGDPSFAHRHAGQWTRGRAGSQRLPGPKQVYSITTLVGRVYSSVRGM